MTGDRRLTASNGRVAHVSLKGAVEAERFVEGSPRQVSDTAALRRDPGGVLDRELLFGDPFLVLDESGGHAFGISEKDGYVGYVDAARLSPRQPVSHLVAVRTTWVWPARDFKIEPRQPFHMNARLTVVAIDAGWAEITLPGGAGFVPASHIRSVDTHNDLVTAAHLMMGTPYVWGGNTGFGLDCSGLIQTAFHAAGWACPGDSDLQERMPGTPLADDAPLRRGDLLFWAGHVGLVADERTLIHANAHHMAVAVEPVEDATARISKTKTGAVTSRLRPSPEPMTYN